MSGTLLLRGDARRLPLADETVDLIVTSPPSWQLRAYATSHPAEVGGELTARAYLEALWAATGEGALARTNHERQGRREGLEDLVGDLDLGEVGG